MGVSFCADTKRTKIWFQSGDISENESGVYNDQNLIISRFQKQTWDEEDVDYVSEEAGSEEAGSNIRDSLTLHMPKSPPMGRPSKANSEPLFRIQRGRQSLLAKMSERSSDPFHDEFVGQKRAVSMYLHALEESTTLELSTTYRNAESLLEKGDVIHEELKRQGKIAKQANRHMRITEKYICDTSHRLKGMESLKSKFKNIIWSKPRGPQVVVVHESDDESSDTRRSSNLPPTLPSYHDKGTKQGMINEGVDRLWHVLDEVEHTQEDISKELGKQEKYLHCLDHNIDHIEHKIHNQTKIMSNIRKK